MIYEIINPSDRYTIDCPDLEIAFVACCLLGNGAYAFDPLDDNGVKVVPLFLFGGHDEWAQEQFGVSTDDVLGRCLKSRRSDVADALDSVLIGKREAFAAIAPENGTDAWREARAKWHDAHRSSFNDIGGRAYQIAAKLRKAVTEAA